MSRSIVLTFGSQVAAILAAVWVTRKIAVAFPAAVAGYVVLRQILQWVLSVGFLGLNVSLPRALAAEERQGARHHIIRASLVLVAPLLALIMLVGLAAPRTAALLLLHDPEQASLFRAASFLFATNGLFALVESVLQGVDRFGALASGRVFAFAVGPAVAVAGGLASGASLPAVLWLWGGTTLVVDAALCVVLVPELRPAPHEPRPGDSLGAICKHLLSYGGLRMVGGIAQFSVSAIAATICLWAGAASDAAAAVSVAALFGNLAQPITLALRPIALTRLAMPLALDEKRDLSARFFATAACAAGAFLGALAVSGDRLVELWLGPQFEQYGTVVRWALVAAGLQFFCYAVEGILDADDPRSERPRAQLVSLGVFIVGAAVGVLRHDAWVSVVAAQVVSSLVLLLLYMRLIARRYALPPVRELVNGGVTVTAACALVGLLLRRGHGFVPTAVMVAGQGAAALALIGVAWATHAAWLTLVLPARAAQRVG